MVANGPLLLRDDVQTCMHAVLQQSALQTHQTGHLLLQDRTVILYLSPLPSYRDCPILLSHDFSISLPLIFLLISGQPCYLVRKKVF